MRSQEVTQKLSNDFVDIAMPYLTMTMADDDARLKVIFSLVLCDSYVEALVREPPSCEQRSP